MNNSKIKLLILCILFLISIFTSTLLFLGNLYEYLIVSIVFSIILFISLIYELKIMYSTPEKKYNHKVNKIIKTYNSILVNTDKFPKLNNKSILKVNILDDLINAHAEIRKPIYYIKNNDATAFYIINEDVFLAYIIKLDENNISSLELELQKIELQSTINLDAIKDYDKTVIIQTNDKSYKVSPIRKENTSRDENKEVNSKKEKSKFNETKLKGKRSNVKNKEIFE